MFLVSVVNAILSKQVSGIALLLNATMIKIVKTHQIIAKTFKCIKAIADDNRDLTIKKKVQLQPH